MVYSRGFRDAGSSMSSPEPAAAGHGAAILAFHEVSKSYPGRSGEGQAALHQVSLQVPAGRVVAIMGRSGSGKSTLLNLAAGIDIPTRGRVLLMGQEVSRLREAQRTRLRREHVGMVFQFFHLLPHLSVAENVALPGWIAGDPAAGVQERTVELLGRVGLADRAADSVQALSGGEMQRVAICRALLRRPTLLLADEPTGNLDDASARAVMDLLVRLAREGRRSLLFVTHDASLASLAHETWHLHSGELVRE